MTNKLKYGVLCLLLATTAALGGDMLIRAKGNILFQSGTGVVKMESPLRAGAIKNMDGSGPAPGGVPVGGVVAVVPNLHANLWQPPVSGAVKDGFMRADGQPVPGSCTTCKIPVGTVLPNMVGKYLKGGASTSGTIRTHANVQLAASNINPITTSPTTTGQLTAGGVATTHTHTSNHSHTVNNTTTTHTHPFSHGHTVSLNTDSGHSHEITLASNPNHTHDVHISDNGTLMTFYEGIGSFNIWMVDYTAGGACYNGAIVLWWAGDHAHPVALGNQNNSHQHDTTLSNTGTIATGYANVGHTHTVTNYSGSTATQSVDHTHNLSSVTVGNASPTAIPLDPAYVEVVWVIRVK